MPNVSFKLPLKHIELLDELVNENKHQTRGEAIREAIKLLYFEIVQSDNE